MDKGYLKHGNQILAFRRIKFERRDFGYPRKHVDPRAKEVWVRAVSNYDSVLDKVEFEGKACANCFAFFPETNEYFYLSKTGLKGLAAICKSCNRKENRRLYWQRRLKELENAI